MSDGVSISLKRLLDFQKEADWNEFHRYWSASVGTIGYQKSWWRIHEAKLIAAAGDPGSTKAILRLARKQAPVLIAEPERS